MNMNGGSIRILMSNFACTYCFAYCYLVIRAVKTLSATLIELP